MLLHAQAQARAVPLAAAAAAGQIQPASSDVPYLSPQMRRSGAWAMCSRRAGAGFMGFFVRYFWYKNSFVPGSAV